MAKKDQAETSAYSHQQASVQRPDVGVEAQFSNRKAPKAYRYDSSVAPELSWDESTQRAFGEWLLALILRSAENGESVAFAEEQVWKGTEERFTPLSQAIARLQSLTKPFLNWAGKAERQKVTVPTLPLFVHERHSTQAILETLKLHKTPGTNLDLFGDINLDVADKLDAYAHKGPWTNRLVLGDSLQVMNSLLEYEGMGGQVQMIYFDPPYGVKFGSNFQPFVRKSSVKNGVDDEMIREPEMVKAYRDTWELGLHSYLAYIRDRLFLSKDLLSDSGSIVVQISDDNLHHVREVLDEVFGQENFCSLIPFAKTTSTATNLLNEEFDYLLWYARNKRAVKYSQIYGEKRLGTFKSYKYAVRGDGKEVRSLTKDEREGKEPVPSDWKIAQLSFAVSQDPGPAGERFYEFKGKRYDCGANRHWKTSHKGLDKLAAANRLIGLASQLNYIRYLDDFPATPITNLWSDTGSAGFSNADPKVYVVQTDTTVVQRCVLMTTEPGDLVLDLTCGSGTTPYVAEQWGRRWIATDTSRVPIALARQRLLTSTFPWYRLKEPAKGPAGGFVYQRKRNKKGEETGGLVPRITLKSIANEEDPRLEVLVDRAEVNDQITRVCGVFTVEASIQAPMNLEQDAAPNTDQPPSSSPRAYLDRMIEVLRQSKTLNLPGNVTLELETVSPLADREYLHAEGVARNGSQKRIAFVFGPEDGAIGSDYVYNAHTEALQQGYEQLFLFGFAIQAKAREMLGRLKIPTVYVAVTPDVVMSDLLKTSRASEIFSITGLPDVELQPAGKRDDGTPLHRVVIKGIDIFRPDTMETDEVAAENLPCWMLDSNYNGMAFFASQVFFPKTSAWENIQKSLKGRFSDKVWEHLAGTVSEPFVLGDKMRVAVKAIDERGNELMVVKSAGGR